MTSEKIRVGKIVGCHGIRGDVKIRPTADDADWAAPGLTLFLQNAKTKQESTATIRTARQQGPLLVVNFKEYENRTVVEPLIGSTVLAFLEDLPEPGEDEFWADDLIGLSVIDSDTGRIRGKVKDLLSSGGDSDFLEIQLDEAIDTVVIPFKEHFFPSVDLENGTITMDLFSDFLSLATPTTSDQLEQ